MKTNRGRHQFKIRLMRKLQNLSILSILPEYILFAGVYLVRPKRGKILCIVAPPRSGSTLTYQILTSKFASINLTNTANFLFAAPILGHKLSKAFCSDYKTLFTSSQGFVDGLCGESEGLRFWQFWSGQGLDEIRNVRTGKLASLGKAINYLSCENEKIYISCFLGHIYLMNELRTVFPDIIFIHLTRNIVDNALSILNQSTNDWFSLKPSGYSKWENFSREEKVLNQIFSIHKRILDDSRGDTIQIDYKDICHSPEQTLNSIISFASSKMIHITRKKQLHELPDFKYKSYNDDPLREKLDIIVKEKIKSLSNSERIFFEKLRCT